MASGMLCWAAVVAAPARKLWPEYEPWQIPMLRKVSRSSFTNRSLVSGIPSLKWNKGPAVSPQTDKYAIIAVIGHRLLWVRPRYMSTPFLKGSVLEDFIRTCMMVGFVGLSTAMSEKLRCAPESYSLSEGCRSLLHAGSQRSMLYTQPMP